MAFSMAFTCFADPLQISVQLSLYLLLTLQLKKLTPVLHALPFFGKLSVSHTRACKQMLVNGTNTKCTYTLVIMEIFGEGKKRHLGHELTTHSHYLMNSHILVKLWPRCTKLK